MVTVKNDPRCCMAEVWYGGKMIYIGNYWDYHTGCFGDELSDFANQVARLMNCEVEYIEIEGNY